MKIKNIKPFIGRNFHNIKGWRSNRKILVIESDDWGSIRMPSKLIYENLLSKGIQVDRDAFMRYDSLASEQDLSALFEVLIKYKDKFNRPATITANTIVANPDFKKIRESNFNKYFFEPFTDTLLLYPDHNSAFDMWKEGICNDIFFPQLHGREHLNVNLWMNYLRNNSKETRITFDLNMFGISTEISSEKRASYMAAFNYENTLEIEDQKDILRAAQDIFYQKFGYYSKSFIAPNYVWSSKLEETMHEIGIEYIQTSRNQILPEGEINKKGFIKHFTGQTNQFGQIYSVRNCIFEPSTSLCQDHVSDCLSQISTAFKWRKPAIISSHRLNYIGFIDEENRTKNLELLNDLLKEVLIRWPNVEFMTSDMLGDFIKSNKNRNDD